MTNNDVSLTLNSDCKVIAIASGKGGVGKSTTAVNIAYALSHHGFKVGLMDADIYGPSLPTLLNITQKTPIKQINQKTRILPFVYKGVTVMSIGFLVNVDDAIAWRGLMVQKAINQLLNDVIWTIEGPLDYLIIDLPPGTGDVQLTLIQKSALTAAIIVSTPQDLALIDVKRAVSMFIQTNIPLLGVIQNMSAFICPCCTQETAIFKTDGLKTYSASLNIPFLADIPLHQDLVLTSDNGTPIVQSNPLNPLAKIYLDIALKIKESL